jgi:hypothetical protein
MTAEETLAEWKQHHFKDDTQSGCDFCVADPEWPCAVLLLIAAVEVALQEHNGLTCGECDHAAIAHCSCGRPLPCPKRAAIEAALEE